MNDFEVFYTVGRLALESPETIYTARSPVKNRVFWYPPPAAIFLSPLSLLPFKVSGAVFALLKTGALVFLLVGSIVVALPKGIRLTGAGLPLLTLAICSRPINNDLGNGQVNLCVAALAMGGVWLSMSRSRSWWIGSGLLALAVALKATPALLLALLVLHRRWKALGAAALWLFAVLLVLPWLCYGPATTVALYKEFQEASSGQVLSARDSDRQVSLSEILTFTIAQARADRDLVNRDGGLYRQVQGKWQIVQLPKPYSTSLGKALWLTIGAAVGVAFLIGRWLLLRWRAKDWPWDLAMLCTLTPLLSPLVRKAHLVILLIPVGYAVCRLCHPAVARSILSVGRRRAAWAGLILCAASLYVSESLAIPSPGPMPYRIAHFFGLIALVVALCCLAGSLEEET